jgi:hypothetical protein
VHSHTSALTAGVQAQPLGIRADRSHSASQLRQWQAIADFDLTRVRARLLREGQLDAQNLDTAILEFRRYLGLHVAEPRPLAMFSKDVDEVWHTCVLFTRLYAQLCTEAFGHFLHHEPTDEAEVEAEPEAEWPAFADAYRALYDQPPGAIWSPPISRRDIDGLETRLNTLAETLSPGERVALGRLLALAVLGTEDDE